MAYTDALGLPVDYLSLSYAGTESEPTTQGIQEESGRAPVTRERQIPTGNITIASLLLIISVVSFVGNTLVLIFCFSKRAKCQPQQKVFMGSLAFADLGVAVGYAWFKAIDDLLLGWPFGLVGCKLNTFLGPLFVHASVGTMAVMAIDR